MRASIPLFGPNTPGGALAVQTRDDRLDAGTDVQLLAGQQGRRGADFEHGGSAQGTHGFVNRNRWRNGGWRDKSPTNVTPRFGRSGRRRGGSDFWLSISPAGTDLTGNGRHEMPPPRA